MTIRWPELSPACSPPRTAGQRESIAGGQPQQLRAPHQCWEHCPGAPRVAPTQERPSRTAGSQPPPQHHPPARTGSSGPQGSCQVPWGSPCCMIGAFSSPCDDTSCVIIGPHRGSLALFTPLSSTPPAGAPQGQGAPQQRVQGAPGSELELTGFELIPNTGPNPQGRPKGNNWPAPALRWPVTAPAAPRSCVAPTGAPPPHSAGWGEGRAGRSYPSPNILAQP